MNSTLPDTITDEQIEALMAEAAQAGDHEMVMTCAHAIKGSEAARAECARVIAEARGEV